MTSRTHDAIAFAALLTVAAYVPLPQMNFLTVIAAVIAADIGAAVPDLDTAGNRLWEMLPQGKSLGKVLRNVFYKYRTITHSLVGIYAMYRFFEWVIPTLFNSGAIDTQILLYSVMIGIVSHIGADSLTEEGVPLFFPLRFTFGLPPVRKMRITTGRWFEHFVVFPGVLLYIVWLVVSRESVFMGIVRSISG